MIKIFPDIEELNNFAAQKFVEIAAQTILQNASFTVALAGGSTPKSLYRLLSGAEFMNKLDWKKVFFFFGDERNVLPEDKESNFRMADENLFKPLEIAREQIFRWQTELKNAEEIAGVYETDVAEFFPLAENELPRFDLILLGMGADGHTASLFPYTEALHETQRFAVANPVEKLQTTRLTLTFPAINNAANVMFLVSGAEKAEALREVLQGEYQPDRFPSQKVKLNNGNLLWLVDEQAASGIQDSRFKIQN
jgi:6-phosphogluconolactonase